MINAICSKALSVLDYLFTKGGLFLSTLLTIFLSAIGYPKQIIFFIIALMIADIITRWYAIVKNKYERFTINIFFKAWKNGVLNSHKLKEGFFVKIFFYAILLIIAHQTSVLPEVTFGDLISNFIYSMVIILDCISVLENMTSAGFSKFKPILNFFKKKKDELIEDKKSEEVAEVEVEIEDNDSNK